MDEFCFVTDPYLNTTQIQNCLERLPALLLQFFQTWTPSIKLIHNNRVMTDNGHDGKVLGHFSLGKTSTITRNRTTFHTANFYLNFRGVIGLAEKIPYLRNRILSGVGPVSIKTLAVAT